MKKRIIILGSVVIAVIVLWSAAWFVAAGFVKQNIEAQALADGVTAPQITCGTLDVGGFPFRFDADCETARIVTGDTVIDMPGIRASIRVYAPTHLLASAQGTAAADRYLHRHPQCGRPGRRSKPACGSTTGASPAPRFRARTWSGPIR